MANTRPVPKHTFAERAAERNLDDSEILNSNNEAGPIPPNVSDIVVAGGGIHGLIYSIHLVKHKPGKLSVSLFEKNSKPGYKIGESTLPLFAMWCKMYGLTAEYLLRIFGMKDGLSFYFLDREKEGHYTDFLINGTPGLYLSGYQLERPMSELLFTLLAQRNGVNVYHGSKIDFAASRVQGGLRNTTLKVAPSTKGAITPPAEVKSSLLIDATGRFRQLASKNASLHRFEGWNYDAFWGYFVNPADESKIPFRFYEGSHTNHLCFPEGWFWVIRLLSWEDDSNSTAKLMDMLTYLLDCAEAGVPGDSLPSTTELAKMFGLKYRWVTSIGVSARNDVKYPDDMSDYGSTEAERKFNYFVRKYPMISGFMGNFKLIDNLYGPDTTWFVRKSLTYQSPVVSGAGWLAIGDACGFTNPLLSPGITANMSTSTFAAELTHKALENAESAKSSQNPDDVEASIRKTLFPYDEFAKTLIPALNQMNCFNYLCFRDPRLGPQVSCVWQNLASVIAGYGSVQGKFVLTPETFLRYATSWRWGSLVPEYDAVARNTVELLKGIPLEEPVPDAIVREVIEFSNKMKAVALKGLEERNIQMRWGGMFRCYDNALNYVEAKTGRDTFARQCSHCASWLVLRDDWTKCYTCGKGRTEEEAAINWLHPAPVVS
ncbi:Flavin-dependent halogenase malA [Paramyrothecium foliicola]|nr:Flavin-dependent halogenase malA [Paramyrothecium foliicola]